MSTPRLVMKGNHTYYLDDKKIDGVTTAIGKGLSKPALVPWAAGAAADYVVDHWYELEQMSTSGKLAKIKAAPNAARDAAAIRGTEIHSYGEHLVHGRPVEIPDQHRGPAEAYAKFLDQWQIEPVATETRLANTKWMYGGTADLWCRIGARDNALALVDLKTGKGVYPDVALQLAAYRYADLWQPDGPDSENDQVPEVGLVYVAHILPDDVRMVPVTAGEAEHFAFLYTLQTARWVYAHSETRKDDSGRYTVRVPLIGEAETA